MAEAPASPGGGSHDSGEHSPRSNVREQDRYLPIANISRIMKKALPANGKIAKDAKETVQECVSEFISFITSEASDKCQREKRKTINGDDLLWAMATLGFEDYIDPLKVYLAKYREMEGDTKGSGKGGESSSKKEVQPSPNAQVECGFGLLVTQSSYSSVLEVLVYKKGCLITDFSPWFFLSRRLLKFSNPTNDGSYARLGVDELEELMDSCLGNAII